MIGKKTDKSNAAPSAASPKKRIIKRLVVESLVAVVVVGALFAVSGILSGAEGDEKKKRDQTETESLQLSGKLQTLKTQMADYVYALPLSKKLLDDAGKSTLTLSRDEASEIFLELHNAYSLEEVKVAISAIDLPQKPNAGRQYVETIQSTINVQMDAYTDEQIYSYISEVMERLPGAVSVESLDMSRGKSYNFNDATDGRDQKPLNKPQIKANITFYWYGLRIKKKPGEAS